MNECSSVSSPADVLAAVFSQANSERELGEHYVRSGHYTDPWGWCHQCSEQFTVPYTPEQPRPEYAKPMGAPDALWEAFISGRLH
jgi:hypothetical protein